MSQSPTFNYIITIHNKEDLIEQVLMCVLMCCRDNSHIYAVLDGCTDGTEKIVDRIIRSFADVPITKVPTADVHELLSINAGLRAAKHEGDGFNIILQDDVLLGDFLLEKKVAALYEWSGPSLGYLSFRLGANFTRDAFRSSDPVPYTEYIENAYGHGIPQAESLLPGYLAYRTVPIKSPVCIPFKVIRSVGMLEERLAPYGHDDPDYAIRAIEAGFRNAVFAIRFYSDVKWGGTRTSPHPQLNDIVSRNMNRIREWHASGLKQLCSGEQPTDVVPVPGMVSVSESKLGAEIWRENCRRLADGQPAPALTVTAKVRSVIKNIVKL